MKLITSSFEILEQAPGIQGVKKQIERAGRTCYKSEDKITDTSCEEFVNRMVNSGHGAMLEHGTIYLRIPEEDRATEHYLGKYDFYGVTPRLWHKEFGTQRGEEIQMWMDKELEKNEIESYVILDDDRDMLPEQMDNFILINGQYGLSDIDVFKAIEILNK